MALRNIRTEGDPCLGKICRPIERFDAKLAALIDDLFDTMYDADGVGLAASQVGVLRRVVVIDTGDGPVEMVNPVIRKQEGLQGDMEGCLSFPGEFGFVTRPYKVKVRYQDRTGQVLEKEGEDLFARCVCHELDHLDGILFRTHVEHYLDPDED